MISVKVTFLSTPADQIGIFLSQLFHILPSNPPVPYHLHHKLYIFVPEYFHKPIFWLFLWQQQWNWLFQCLLSSWRKTAAKRVNFQSPFLGKYKTKNNIITTCIKLHYCNCTLSYSLILNSTRSLIHGAITFTGPKHDFWTAISPWI